MLKLAPARRTCDANGQQPENMTFRIYCSKLSLRSTTQSFPGRIQGTLVKIKRVTKREEFL
jgi:hypothetical protein